MAYTLSDLLQDAYEELGQLNVGYATGGSTTTVVDSVRAGFEEQDDDWKEGTMFITRDSAGASAAPEGEFQRISAYVANTGTFTVDTAFTAAPASGDTYSFASSFYPLRTMIELANAGLRGLGNIALMDTTTLDTAANQTEYAAAVAWKYSRPRAIDIQSQTGDANDNRWVRIYDWDWVPATPGSTGLIVFKTQPINTRDIRIWYTGAHPRLSIYSSVVSETIHPELALSALVERAMRWQVRRSSGSDPFLVKSWQDARVELDRARVLNPIWKPARRSQLLTLNRPDYYPGEPDKVRLTK